MPEGRPPIDGADSILDPAGHTPLARLPSVSCAEGVRCTLVAKLDPTNPGGSVKDRVAVALVDAAERDGLLKPGGTIVEPTSGNTGSGLAIVAAQRGYRCIFVMSDKMSDEKVALLRAYGAEVVVCPTAVPPEDPRSYYSTAQRRRRLPPRATLQPRRGLVHRGLGRNPRARGLDRRPGLPPRRCRGRTHPRFRSRLPVEDLHRCVDVPHGVPAGRRPGGGRCAHRQGSCDARARAHHARPTRARCDHDDARDGGVAARRIGHDGAATRG